MIVPLLLTAVLLVGVVLLMGDAADPRNTVVEREVAQEGERLLDNLEVIVGGARWINVDQWPEDVPPTGDRSATLDLLENLDGDSATGCFEADGVAGMERVFIFRPGKESRRLLARVYSSPDLPPQVVELTNLLDENDPVAFQVEYLSDARRETVIIGDVVVSTRAPGIDVDGLRLTVTIRDNGASGRFSRVIESR